jgi:hypothetical protein
MHAARHKDITSSASDSMGHREAGSFTKNWLEEHYKLFREWHNCLLSLGTAKSIEDNHPDLDITSHVQYDKNVHRNSARRSRYVSVVSNSILRSTIS